MPLRNALSLVQTALVMGLAPEPNEPVSVWAEKNRIVPDGARPGRWSNATAPYLTEVMDCLSPSDPCDSVTLIKSAQCGGSEIASNWLGYIIDRAPGNVLVVHPSVEAARDWITEKFEPTIEATPILASKVSITKSRSGKGSTGRRKRFPGGFMLIAGSNSSAGLRQHSMRYLIKDDWSDWTPEISGQGDPDDMANARQMSFHATGTAKTFQVSTPTVRGLCRVTKAFEAGDQRRYQVPCPHCGSLQTLEFSRLKFGRTQPYGARYECAECHQLIDHASKGWMLANGHWMAEKPHEGRQPSFSINSLYSPFTTWDKVAESFWAAKDDPAKMRAFINLWLGEAVEEKGEAPDLKRLLALREDWPSGKVPPGGLVLTAGADVHLRGIWVEVVAWGPRRESWSVQANYLPGDVNQPEVWQALDNLLNDEWLAPNGHRLKIEMMGIDTGYRHDLVHDWARTRSKVMAVKGMTTRDHPTLGQAHKVDVSVGGRKIRRGLALWPVGVWRAKAEFYQQLRLEHPKESGGIGFPAGYCHFGADADENTFKQLTSEALVTRINHGKRVTEWVKHFEDNHLLDCRVYAAAAAERLGLWRKTPEFWQTLQDEMATPPHALPDLFDPARMIEAQPALAARRVQETGAGEADWFGGRGSW